MECIMHMYGIICRVLDNAQANSFVFSCLLFVFSAQVNKKFIHEDYFIEDYTALSAATIDYVSYLKNLVRLINTPNSDDIITTFNQDQNKHREQLLLPHTHCFERELYLKILHD